jgi:transcriptional regulator with XRE-family HTH domain
MAHLLQAAPDLKPRRAEILSSSRIDRHVGDRLRERRVMLGITQQRMAELIGVTYQQAHKYEKGINRISAGRLHQIALVLGVGVEYFYQGLGGTDAPDQMRSKRLFLELSRTFMRIPASEHQEALLSLAEALAGRTPR